MGIHNNALIGAGGQQGYTINRSVRLRASATAYLSRTPAAASNRKTWTWSGWRKRGTLGGDQTFFEAQNGTTFNRLGIDGNLNFNCNGGTSAVATTFNVASSALIRDPSAWYHFVVSFDTTQATASNRIRLYINGVQVTALASSSYPNQNTDWSWNAACAHNIGRYVDSTYGPNGYFDGYATEDIFIDGQALSASSFGEINPVSGTWRPKKYTGTYGTNGFYLNFSDPSAATAAAIGKDYSGNGNNWTPNNISVTAGATYDSMLDVPTMWTDGGNGRGNYCTWNPLSTIAFPLSNANLSIGASATNNRVAKGTIAVSSGQWYWEMKHSALDASGALLGVCSDGALFSAGVLSSGYDAQYYSVNGNKYLQGVNSAYGASFTTADTIGVALDLTNNQITFYKNNTSQGAISIPSGVTWVPCWLGQNTGDTVDANFGQRPFAYTPPTGFKALNTQNLPDPTIKKPSQWMDATTYTGNGTSQSIVNSGAFQPDLVWVKERSAVTGGSGNHFLQDSVRGVANYLISNSTAAESTTTPNIVSALNSNGFSVAGNANSNENAHTYIGWQWKKGVTPGFDIVTFTGNGSAQAINHSLGVAPKMVIYKARSVAGYSWTVWHTAYAATNYLILDGTQALNANIAAFNNTAPTSTQFSVGTSGSVTAATYVAYLFAEVAGFSKFGSYTGNGSSDGPFVFCGFRPRFVLIKRTDTTEQWRMWDTARDAQLQPSGYELYPNLTNPEAATTNFDYLSNGFKLRQSVAGINASGGTYIYAAFAENPFKYSLAR